MVEIARAGSLGALVQKKGMCSPPSSYRASPPAISPACHARHGATQGRRLDPLDLVFRMD